MFQKGKWILNFGHPKRNSGLLIRDRGSITLKLFSLGIVEENGLFRRSFCNFHVVGVQKARKIAGSYNLPIVGVHHMEAHALVAR